MKVSDIIRQKARDARGKGLRPCTIQLDHDGLRELILQAGQSGSPMLAHNGMYTFLGMPIEQGPQGEVGMLFVRPTQRYIAWEIRNRDNARWDLFDLDAAELVGNFFETREAANDHARMIERELKDSAS